MKNITLLALGVLVLLITLTLTGCNDTGGVASTAQPVNVITSNQQTGIWVNGSGKITVTPDLAVITLGVSSQNATVAEAQANSAAAMEKIMNVLTGQGVDKKDIQTNYYNISQVTRWDDRQQVQVVVGYSVSNSVIVKLREIVKVGEVIDAVANAGGDLTRINGISFSVEKPEQYYQQVRELALKDAKSRADQLASLSGVTLGKPTYVSENSSSGVLSPPLLGASPGGGVSTPVSAGSMDITLNVQISYAIK